MPCWIRYVGQSVSRASSHTADDAHSSGLHSPRHLDYRRPKPFVDLAFPEGDPSISHGESRRLRIPV